MSFIQLIYSPFIGLGKLIQSPLLLAIRLYWGFLIAQAGWGKLLNLEKTAAFFTDLHIPQPYLNAIAAAGIEFFGGLLIFFGIASRLASLPLIVVMVVAYLAGSPDSLRSLETFVSAAPFNFLLAFLIILAFGPGMFSVDYLVKRAVMKPKD